MSSITRVGVVPAKIDSSGENTYFFGVKKNKVVLLGGKKSGKMTVESAAVSQFHRKANDVFHGHDITSKIKNPGKFGIKKIDSTTTTAYFVPMNIKVRAVMQKFAGTKKKNISSIIAVKESDVKSAINATPNNIQFNGVRVTGELAGILHRLHPKTGTPQSGLVSPFIGQSPGSFISEIGYSKPTIPAFYTPVSSYVPPFIGQSPGSFISEIGYSEPTVPAFYTPVSSYVPPSVPGSVPYIQRFPNIVVGKHLSHKTQALRPDWLGIPVQEYHDNFIHVGDDKRFGARNMVSKVVNKTDLRLPIVSDLLKKVCLFSEGKNHFYSVDGKQLLGRFDVLAIQARMNYNDFWDMYKSDQKHFYIHHAAALNIGESARAADFKDYSTAGGTLDETKYLDDMTHIFDNIFISQEKMGITDAVLFPFGMGAFLRNLGKNDPSYNDPDRLYRLREKIAASLFAAVKAHPSLNIHLCLPKGKAGEESTQNYNAFINVLEQEKATLASRVKLYINVDAPRLAQDLANKAAGSTSSVSLVNGANRSLIGNHWFGDRARAAIDENLHRRSVSASTIAKVLNNGAHDATLREENELGKRVQLIGGRVIGLRP